MVRDFGRHDPTSAFVFSPNGRFLWHFKQTGDYTLCSTETGSVVQQMGLPITFFAGDGSRYNRMQFGNDGTRFVTQAKTRRRDAEEKTTLWDFDTGERVCELFFSDGGHVDNATFTPDGRKLVTVDTQFLTEEETVYPRPCRTGLLTWDAATGSLLAADTASDQWTSTQATQLVYTHEGHQCLTVHTDAIILWDLASAAPLRVFPEESSPDLRAVLSADDRSLLTISPGYGATVWNLATGEQIQTFRQNRVSEDDVSESIWTRNARFTQDGQHVVVASHRRRAVHLMSVETGQRLWSFYLMSDGNQAVSITPGGPIHATSPSLVRYRQFGVSLVFPLGQVDEEAKD
jgi:WD40 repeat protein